MNRQAPGSPTKRAARRIGRAGQGGAATLVVVMVLFFVLSLAAAYAGRNMIFEGRTSANQYASTRTAEAGQAAIEWAASMLNAGRVDDNCQPTTDTTKATFRQRYLTIDPVTGEVNRAGPYGTLWWAACAFDASGTGLNCSCPTGSLPTSGGPSGGPAFAVRFAAPGSLLQGSIRVEVNACASYDPAGCLIARNLGVTQQYCQSGMCSLLSLASALKAPPVAAVTARGSVTGTFEVYSTDSAATGITVYSGDNVASDTLTLGSSPGTPRRQSVRADDNALRNLPDDSASCMRCTFASTFGLTPDVYRHQPAVKEIDCSGGCTASTVNTELAGSAGRVLWLQGDATHGLTVDGSADIGATTSPVVMVINGPLTMSAGATAKVYGVIYASNATVNGGELHGALVTPGAVSGAAPGRVFYEPTVVTRLRATAGSFVRVPGSWRDFP
jgi:hypothetical protein